MYKLIVLIIYSENIPVFKEMKALSTKYHELYADTVKYFYVQYNNEITEDLCETGNIIHVCGNESGTEGYGIYAKTIKAMQHIINKYDFEFVMRTNISSFLCLDNILKYLDTIPKSGYAGGYSWGTHLSGTGIFMSRDVIEILTKDIRHLVPYDDYNISAIIKQNKIKTKCIQIPYSIRFVENNKYDENLYYDKNVLYFRIKNKDREIDIMYFKNFLKRIYGIQPTV